MTDSDAIEDVWARAERRRRLLATVEYLDEPLPARTLWPVRPWPMPDELLSSWLNRVAVANGLAPRSLHLALAKSVRWKSTLTRNVMTHDRRRSQVKESCWVDLRCEKRIAGYLAERSGLPVRLIQSLALRRPKDVPAGTPTPASTLQWELLEALPTMIRPDEDSHGYMRFCPYCLAEWDDPWFRKVWRTSLAEACTRHACHLLLNCVCGKSIRPHLARTTRSQAFCYSCNQDLRRIEAKPAFLHEMKAQKESYRRAYEEVETIVRNGNDHVLIIETIRKPIPDGVLYLYNKPRMDLRKTGLIDAYASNSALSLWLTYRDVRRSNPFQCGIHRVAYRYPAPSSSSQIPETQREGVVFLNIT